MSVTLLSAAALPIAIDVVATIKNSIEAIKIWFEIKDRFKTRQKLSEQALELSREENKVKAESNDVAQLISEDILRAFQKRINACKVKLETVLDSPDRYFEDDVDNATRAYISCICRELNRVYELNKKIPDGQMKNFWDNYSCYSSSPFNTTTSKGKTLRL